MEDFKRQVEELTDKELGIKTKIEIQNQMMDKLNSGQMLTTKEYKSLPYKGKILFNSERTAKNTAVIMWVLVLPLICSLLFGGIYLLASKL